MRRFFAPKKEFISEINVTPFVDVLLILVVILLVTLPVLVNTADVKINLPKTALKDDQATKEPIILSMNTVGEYFYENKKMSTAEILEKLLERKKKGFSGVIVIRSDKDLPYGKVVSFLALLKNNGFDRIGLTIEKPNA